MTWSAFCQIGCNIWIDAAEKARHLLNLFAASMDARDPRRQKLIAAVLEDFNRLPREESDGPKDGSWRFGVEEKCGIFEAGMRCVIWNEFLPI
jgi:hypothetical protein